MANSKLLVRTAIGPIVVLGLLCVIAPKLGKSSSTSPLNIQNADAHLASIEANLKLLEAAKEEWGFVNRRAMSDGVTVTDLTQYFPGYYQPPVIVGESYVLSTVASFAEARLPLGITLNGKTGPFTITSFD